MGEVVLMSILIGMAVGVVLFVAWCKYDRGAIVAKLIAWKPVEANATKVESIGMLAFVSSLCLWVDNFIGYEGLVAADDLKSASAWARISVLASMFFFFTGCIVGYAWVLTGNTRRERHSIYSNVRTLFKFIFHLLLDTRDEVEAKSLEHRSEELDKANLAIISLLKAEEHLRHDIALLESSNRELTGFLKTIGECLKVIESTRALDIASAQLTDDQRANRINLAASYICRLIADGFGGDGSCHVSMYIEDKSARRHSKFTQFQERLRIIGWSDLKDPVSEPEPKDLPDQFGLVSLEGLSVLYGSEFWLPNDMDSLKLMLARDQIPKKDYPAPLKAGSKREVRPTLLYPIPKQDLFPEGTYGVAVVKFKDELPSGQTRNLGENLCRTGVNLFDAINRALAPTPKQQRHVSRRQTQKRRKQEAGEDLQS